MKYILLILLLSGCAIGVANVETCQARGVALGRGRIHVECGEQKEAPLSFREETDQTRTEICETNLCAEVSGGPASLGFWSLLGEMASYVGAFLAARFGFGI